MALAFLSRSFAVSTLSAPFCEVELGWKQQQHVCGRQIATEASAFSSSHAQSRTRRICLRLRGQTFALLTPQEAVGSKADEQSSTQYDLSRTPVSSVGQKSQPAILLTEKATMHLRKLKAENDALCLRIGVRQGGCSGMSYIMDFEDQSNVRVDDSVVDADGITLVIDPKSLLFLFGMQLDYSDTLIGGGFSFNNPNATSSCGCGKSFAA